MGGAVAGDRGQARGAAGAAVSSARRSRRWVWVWLLVCWAPVWALIASLVLTAHGGALLPGLWIGLRMSVAAALLGLVVRWLVERLRWPPRSPLLFVAAHVVAAPAYAISWI